MVFSLTKPRQLIVLRSVCGTFRSWIPARRSRIVQLKSLQTLAETPISARRSSLPTLDNQPWSRHSSREATSHRRFVKPSGALERSAVLGSGQQILWRIARPTDAAAYSIRLMIRDKTRDSALMSSLSAKRIESEWNRCSPVVAMPHRFSLAISSGIAVLRARLSSTP